VELADRIAANLDAVTVERCKRDAERKLAEAWEPEGDVVSDQSTGSPRKAAQVRFLGTVTMAVTNTLIIAIVASVRPEWVALALTGIVCVTTGLVAEQVNLT
jgi:hypothetical protein